jgi:ABC-type polysaccharide/polyol phosphate transport system ATPase subunit
MGDEGPVVVGGAGPLVSAGALTVQGLGKRYPTRPHEADVWALRDVSFDVPPGGALAIVGENGSGKSTLLDLLMGATLPSQGTLAVAGPTSSLLELGAGFFVELSGRDNSVQMGLLSGLARAEARTLADAVAGFAELGDFFDRPVRTYSAGMVMRLGFAIASSLRAPVVLVDEVLAVGDGYFQRKCVDRLREMRAGGSTLVVASHDLHALKGLCDRALWLRQGRTVALGPAEEVIGRYEEHLRLKTAEAPGLTPGRRGTGEVAIRAVRLKGTEGRERTEFRSGETLRVEVDFDARRPLDSPVMGIAIFREDGVYCCGPNTRHDASLAGTYHGRYRLTAEFLDLPLLGGGYEVSVSFYDKDHVYAYAWDHRLYPFRVVMDPPEHGLVSLRHRFHVSRIGDAGAA